MEWLVHTRQPLCNLNSNNFVNKKVLFSYLCAIILQAQAMKEQAQLREEMAYQYKLGNFEVRIKYSTLFGLWLLAWASTKFAAIFITIGCCRNPAKVGPWCCRVVGLGHLFVDMNQVMGSYDLVIMTISFHGYYGVLEYIAQWMGLGFIGWSTRVKYSTLARCYHC